MQHRFLGSYAIVFVVTQHLVNEVQRLFRDHVLVAVAHKVRPWLLIKLLALHQLFHVLRYFQVVLVHIFVKVIFSKYAHNSN